MDLNMFIFVLIFAFIGLILMATIGITWESKDFNKGNCKLCGTKLRHFDNDSQSGRLYICDKCGYYTSVSYNCVDKLNRNLDED